MNSRRDLRFTLMLNPEERAELERRASRLGLSVAGYLRMRALGRTPNEGTPLDDDKAR